MTTRPTLQHPECSAIARRMLQALIDHGALEAHEWSVHACASLQTVKAYVGPLLRFRRIHASGFVRNANNQEVRTYSYGPGNGVVPAPLPPEIEEEIPVAMPIPRPDAITAALMRL